MNQFDFYAAYDILLAYGVSEQVLIVACCLEGFTLETLDSVCDILFSRPSVISLVKNDVKGV